MPIRYAVGFHSATTSDGAVPFFDVSLILVHLHSFDRGYCEWRERRKFERALKTGKGDENELGMNAHTGGGWAKAFLLNCQLALYFGKDPAEREGGESKTLVVGSQAFVNYDGFIIENVVLTSANIGGEKVGFTVIWKADMTWKDTFDDACPGCAFEGEEPTRVEGDSLNFISFDEKAGEPTVFHLTSRRHKGETIMRIRRRGPRSRFEIPLVGGRLHTHRKFSIFDFVYNT